jgi:hypothetical protein
VVYIDPTSRFFYREKREGGQTFFFSALRTEKIVKATPAALLVQTGDTLTNTLPDPSAESAPPRRTGAGQDHPDRVYLAVDYEGEAADLSGALLYIDGGSEQRNLLRWARWYPADGDGFNREFGFCPGLQPGLSEVLRDPNQTDWGGLRSTATLFGSLDQSFCVLPESIAGAVSHPEAPESLRESIRRNRLKLAPPQGNRYWLRIDLPPGGDRIALNAPVGFYFDAFVAINKNELSLFKHTGGNRLVEIEIPDSLDKIVEITSVTDSANRVYQPSYEVHSDRDARSYSLEEREDRLVLWFDFSSGMELPPDSISVTYATTEGTTANGVEAGRITNLYESHPGVVEAENLSAVTGAVPAKTAEQIVEEVSSRLRSRDRALSFPEIARWVRSFDPRIKQAECRNGVERFERGVRRCVVVDIGVDGGDFYSDDEVNLLKERLGAFLKQRAPVNTQFAVEVWKQ